MEKSVTMKDIAEKLNISVVSVSKALSGKEGVSDRIREKILRTADEMGYQYSLGKKSLLKLAVLIPEQFLGDNTFYGDFCRKLSKFAKRFGFSAFLETVTEECEKSCDLPDAINEFSADGIIFLGEISERYIKNVAKKKIPFVLLDFYDSEGKYDAVISSGFLGSYHLTKMLIDEGLKSLAFIGNINATSSIMDRFLGFFKAINENSIEFQKKDIIPDRLDSGTLCEIKLPEVLPDAFVCNCDQAAYFLINELNKKGFKVPQDVAVVGFDDSKFATLCNPPLTTYRVDIDSMCETALKVLSNKIKGKKNISMNVTVRGKTILRDSHLK